MRKRTPDRGDFPQQTHQQRRLEPAQRLAYAVARDQTQLDLRAGPRLKRLRWVPLEVGKLHEPKYIPRAQQARLYLASVRLRTHDIDQPTRYPIDQVGRRPLQENHRTSRIVHRRVMLD